jgi:Tfp pilus assembly pilus retraction ATPase PilT
MPEHDVLVIGAGLSQDEDENIEVVRVPLRGAPDLIRRGEIKDAKSIASLLLVLSRP